MCEKGFLYIIYVSIHDVVDNRLLATQMNLSFAMSENLFLQHSFMKPSDLIKFVKKYEVGFAFNQIFDSVLKT